MQNSEFRRQNSDCTTLESHRWPGVRRTAVVTAFCILHSALLFSFVGCASKARAQALPDGPPLAVPLPPAHEIAIEQIAEAPPPEPPPAPEPVPPAPRPATAGTRTPASPETRETPAPAVVQAPPPPQPQPEVPAVRATTSIADERRVRDLMRSAATDLTRVDYKKLSKEGQSQYDQSKRFSDQAQQAIKEKNFAYALTLAEKAANIAAELVR